MIVMPDQASLRCKKWRNPLALKHSTCQSLKSAPTDPDAPPCTMNTVISQAKRASSLYLTNSQSNVSGRRVTLQSLVLAVHRHWLMGFIATVIDSQSGILELEAGKGKIAAKAKFQTCREHKASALPWPQEASRSGHCATH